MIIYKLQSQFERINIPFLILDLGGKWKNTKEDRQTTARSGGSEGIIMTKNSDLLSNQNNYCYHIIFQNSVKEMQQLLKQMVMKEENRENVEPSE